MFGIFRTSKGIGELAEEVAILKSKVRVLETENFDAQEKVLTILKKMEARYNMRDIRADEVEKDNMLKEEILGLGIDINNPQDAIQKIMKNPKIMQLAIAKLGKELVI